MATVSPGVSGRIDMLNLQLYNLQYGHVPIYDAGLVRVDNGGGRFADFQGSFTYPPSMGGYSYDAYGYPVYENGSGNVDDYYPNAGTVTRIVETTSAGLSIEIAGLSVSPVPIFNAAKAGDGQTVVSLVFAGDDTLAGTSGDDWIDGWGGNDSISGGAGADSVRGLDGNDTLLGGSGADDVNGNRGDDIVHGDDGADIVRGGQGNDTVYGDAGDDPHVNGNIGDDVVFGGTGDDMVFGGQNNDRLFGEDGDDTLSGDLGNDTLAGGAGADRFVMRADGGVDIVTDFNAAQGDRVQLVAGQAFTVTAQGADTVVSVGGTAQIILVGVAPGDFVVFA